MSRPSKEEILKRYRNDEIEKNKKVVDELIAMNKYIHIPIDRRFIGMMQKERSRYYGKRANKTKER